MLIFLIGYMGSGKSTIARKLAKKLELQFIDLDTFIEERNFCTIPEIFANHGEAVFREKEHKAIKEVIEFENVIIATGGGAPCFFNNIQLMNKAGISIFINVPSKTLAERLLNSKIDRPLIKGKSQTELEDFLNTTLAQRNPFYKQAKLIVNVGENETVDELADRMEKQIKANIQ